MGLPEGGGSTACVTQVINTSLLASGPGPVHEMALHEGGKGDQRLYGTVTELSVQKFGV